MGIIEKGANNTLNALDACFVEWGRRVLFRRVLLFSTLDNFAVPVGRELGLCRCLVAFLKEKVADVVLHGQAACAVAMASSVVPAEVDPSKLFPLPVFRHFIVLVEDSKEMVSMFAANVFNTKVIDDEHKLYRAPNMAPESWRGSSLMSACSIEALAEEVIRKSSRLWNSVSAADDSKIHPALVDEG